jgi:hypothetical protein
MIVVRPLDFTIDYEAVYPMCDEHFYDLKRGYYRKKTEEDKVKLREYDKTISEERRQKMFRSRLEFMENKL